MRKAILSAVLFLLSVLAYGQGCALGKFLSDSIMKHASVTISIRNADNGDTIVSYMSAESLIPASVLKLITTGSALELLGPGHTFSTVLGYTGNLNKKTGRLKGNIIIKGGGDPALGSKYFEEHYPDFPDNWVTEIKKMGIKRIDGKVLTDDSYFDFEPVSSRWQWEDLGNYYGAGVYGLSVFDNSAEIHLTTSSENSTVTVSSVIPKEYRYDYKNMLTASGDKDDGYIFSVPYSNQGWIAGTVPVDQQDFILEASVADPPLLFARLFDSRLRAAGINIREEPSTVRLDGKLTDEKFEKISEIVSPPLSEIIKVLNHESVNLFAETLLKEIGKVVKDDGSSAAGISAEYDFLKQAGIDMNGMFVEDGSGLSPRNAINSGELTSFLIYMKNRGHYFNEYFSSLPRAGKDGTLKAWFKDPVFDSSMSAKSGSMDRVRCYAGYFTTRSGKNMVFSILVNNYTGPYPKVIASIEDILKEIILYK